MRTSKRLYSDPSGYVTAAVIANDLDRSSEPLAVKPSQEVVTVRPATVIQIGPSLREPSVVVRPRLPVTVLPSTVPTSVVRPTIAVCVDPPKRGAWAERGWTVHSEGRSSIYEGDYQIGRRRFPGRIQVEGISGRITAFIHNPPKEIKRHRKGPCFQQYGIGTGWFVLHWRKPARNVDDAILYMERVLDESLGR